MHRILFIFFLFLVADQAVVAQAKLTGRVVGISDGDTFTMLLPGNRQVRIRLHGVDCPEKNQDFGARARAFTADLTFGKTVSILIKDRDRYGRTVGLVTLPSGKILQEELLKNGLAWHYRRYDKSPRFAALEARARAGKTGLWSMKKPAAPWEFRKRRRSAAPAPVSPLGKAGSGSVQALRCGALTASGTPCKRLVSGGGYCYQHG